jgi:NHLM bacteriocin system ABC transporter peptidase/ATP-binding protein
MKKRAAWIREFFSGKRGRVVRTPTVIQMEAVECGAAALSIILSFHRRFIPLEELRIVCGVSRDGSKASSIVRAARSYGLTAKGLTREPAGLRTLRLPFIVFWNFNHFVVVEGFRGEVTYINDPANGRRRVTRSEFDDAFTGVVLAFEKGPEFKAGGRPPSAWRALMSRLPGARTGLLYVVLVSLAMVLPGMAIPAYTRVFVDEILIRGKQTWLLPLLALMAGTAVINAMLTYLLGNALLRLQMKLSLQGSSRFFQHLMRLPLMFFQQRQAGDIASRISLNNRVASLLSGDLASAGVSLLVVGFFMPLLFQYDVTLTLLGLSFALVNLLVMRYVSQQLAAGSMKTLTERNKLAGISMNGLQGIESIKASGGEDDFFCKWAGHYAKVFTHSQSIDATSLGLTAAAGFIAALNGVALLSVGGRRVIDGFLTIGMLMGFQTLMAQFMGPFHQVLGLYPKLQAARADLNQLDDVLKNHVQAEPETTMELGEIDGSLELRDLQFGYNRLDAPLIQDLSLSLTPGQRVALVGGSGSGKSTVAKLVCGLYQPWQGEILIDGRPRAEWPRRVLANSVAVVDQDILLFEGTIRENLTLWDPTIEDGDLFQAGQDAAIHNDITVRDGGYNQPVEESGRNFSGGQRQRLEIARALALNPRILILDEATSALDAATEKIVDDNLRRRGCTCLIIAHRLSTIRDCDEIVVLDAGKVVERGTHHEMMKRGGAYARLVSAG